MDSGILPRWRYHRTEEARVVHTEEELAELGPEWRDNPRMFEDEDEAAAAAAAIAPAEPEPEPIALDELAEEKPAAKKNSKKKQ